MTAAYIGHPPCWGGIGSGAYLADAYVFDIDDVAKELRKIVDEPMGMRRRGKVAAVLIRALHELRPPAADLEGGIWITAADHVWITLGGRIDWRGVEQHYVPKESKADPPSYASESAAVTALPALLREHPGTGFAVVWRQNLHAEAEAPFDEKFVEVARLTRGELAANVLALSVAVAPAPVPPKSRSRRPRA